MIFKTLASVIALAGLVQSQTPPGFTPQSMAYFPVTYDNATAPSFFTAGGVYNKSSVQYAPNVYIPDISSLKSKTFLILMVDPDAPSPSNITFSEILHWLQPGVKVVKNAKQVKGPDGTTNLVKLNTTMVAPIVPYRGPAPPSAAPHRYIFMLFVQPDPNSFTLPAGYEGRADGADRRLFDAEDFVDAAELDEPIGGNYFLSGFSTDGNGTQLYTGGDAAEGATEPVGGNQITSPDEDPSATDTAPGPTDTSDAANLALDVWWITKRIMPLGFLYFLFL